MTYLKKIVRVWCTMLEDLVKPEDCLRCPHHRFDGRGESFCHYYKRLDGPKKESDSK